MVARLFPLQYLIATLALWLNRHQQEVIDYLLVAQKWNFVHRRSPGRPGTKDEIVSLILRMAEENPNWGYTRIRVSVLLVHRVPFSTPRLAWLSARSTIKHSPDQFVMLSIKMKVVDDSCRSRQLR